MTDSTPSFFAEDLLSTYPSIIVDKVDPRFENLQTEIVIPAPDHQKMESFVPRSDKQFSTYAK